MIGKITIGKSFRGCIVYCLNDKIQQHNEQVMKDRAEVLLYNKCFGNERKIVQQFNEVRQLNSKLSKPVLHITLSLDPADQLPKNKLMEICEHCAKEMGFENNQYIAISHRNTNHQHIHIIANRIGFDKRTVSDSNSYKKIASYCRKMEQRYQLKQVLSPRKYLSGEQRNIPRYDQRKEWLRENIKQALSKSRNYNEFEQRMKEKGYQIVKGRGIFFTDEKKVTVKGSEVGYSLQTIEQILQKQSLIQQQHLTKIEHRQVQHLGKEISKENNFSVQEKQQQKAQLLEQLLKPEKQQQENSSIFQQRKKKKKQRLHL